jgi:hypothetical protein
VKSKILSFLIPSLLIAAMPLSAAAQTVGTTIDLIPENADPLGDVTYNYPGVTGASTPLGLIQFQTTGSSPTTYYTYCIDLSMSVTQYQTYTFTYQYAANSPTGGTGFPILGSVDANYLSLLYGAVFGSSSVSAYAPNNYSAYNDIVSPLQGNSGNLPTLHQAFQLAVSDIVFGSGWNVTTGTFAVTAGALPDATLQANEWLSDVENAGSGAYSMPLIALTSPGAQDQILPGIAIPEPSAYAAFLGAAALGFAVIRHRKVRA